MPMLLRTILVLLTALLFVGRPALAAPVERFLLQGAYVEGTETYRFNYRSIPSLLVADAPEDADWSRWAMMHDGETYILLIARQGAPEELYRFGYDFETERYRRGFRGPERVSIAGRPPEASLRNFAVLHDGRKARLFLQDRNDFTLLHQFALNEATGDFEYGHSVPPRIAVEGFPPDADWRRWAMLHDGTRARIYAFRRGSEHQLYQGAYDEASNSFRFGHDSIQVLTLLDFPAASDRNGLALLHDGVDYRIYLRER